MKRQQKFLICLLILALASPIAKAQNLEVQGKVKITEMDTIGQDSFLLVRQSDGTLAEMSTESITNNFNQVPDTPRIVGNFGLGTNPLSIYVSGRYAYIAEQFNHLKVVDVSDPSAPAEIGSLALNAPYSVYVSGRYAYVLDQGDDSLKVIDISDPSDPTLVGGTGLGTLPFSLYVSGRYAYVADQGTKDLRVIDISDPSNPYEVGSVGLGSLPNSMHVSGRYAYVVDPGTSDLRVFDVSDPSNPNQVGDVVLSAGIFHLYVSGRYAYVVDHISNTLRVIDVSDPSNPTQVGSVGIGGTPRSVFVSGRYAYVVDSDSDDLNVIDVSDPGSPSVVGHVSLGTSGFSVYVSGRYAYAVGFEGDLRVIDVSGAEVTSMVAHSLEAGNLQVRNDIIAQGQIQVSSGVNIGAGGLYSDGNVGIAGSLALTNDIPPTSSPANMVQLYAEDVTASSELKVRDEAGNITTLSPHNFSLIGEPSEEMAWSFYSENRHGKINVDMLKTIRTVERISGETLVNIQNSAGNIETLAYQGPSLTEQIEMLKKRNHELEEKMKTQEKELARIKEILGIQ